MRKFFRFLGILLLILVVGFLIVCAVSPSETKIERSTMINAPAATVWEQMVKFKNWSNWSPWQEMDSTIVVTYSGEDGQPGSKYMWTSKNSGSGEATNKGVNGMEMQFEMHFMKPFEATSNGMVKVTEENGQTKATWTYEGKSGFFMRGFGAIMGMRKMLEKSYDRGLQLLKEYTEKNPGAAGNAGGGSMDIKQITFEGKTYATIRKTITWDEMEKFFGDAYGQLGQAAGDRINGPASAIYYMWDEANHKADVAAAMPVSAGAPIAGATMVEVPSGNASMIAYKGGYTGSMAAHEALGKHMTDNKTAMGLVIEEYVVGPTQQKDSNQYVTNIYYLEKK